MFEKSNGTTIFQGLDGLLYIINGPFPEPLKIIFLEAETARKAKDKENLGSRSSRYTSYFRGRDGLFRRR